MAKPLPITQYFGPSYHYLYQKYLLPEEQTLAEAEFVLRVLRPRGRERWLDIPCGFGRHTLALRALKSGLRVFGLDRAMRFLREPALRGLSRSVCGDWRALPFGDESFDAVLNLFNSFGYHPPRAVQSPLRRRHVAGDAAILDQWRRVLRPGGRLLMDLSNRRTLVQTVRRQPMIRYVCGGIETIEKFSWDAESECLVNETRWRWEGGRERGGYRLRLYTPGQLKELLNANEFEISDWFGDFAGAAFDAHRSDRMIVVAMRRL